MQFTADGKYLISLNDYGVLQTYDLLTGHLIDHFQTVVKIVGFSYSSASDYLATIQEGNNGILLW